MPRLKCLYSKAFDEYYKPRLYQKRTVGVRLLIARSLCRKIFFNHHARLVQVKNMVSVLGSFGNNWEQKGRNGLIWAELGRICG
jgi:hypothetical protein